jgi:hypothetical protein
MNLRTVIEQKRAATSLYVDPELWKEVKIEAIRREITVTELFEQALRKELKTGTPAISEAVKTASKYAKVKK